MTKDDLVIGEKYNWKSQPERLIGAISSGAALAVAVMQGGGM